MGGNAPYVSPYLLEILSTRPGAPSWTSATGSLVANTGQTVSCSRASSAYCLGDDGLLHLLGANTVRVEPQGLLREGPSTNLVSYSTAIGTSLGSVWSVFGAQAPTVALNTTDVTDPAGGNAATKAVWPSIPTDGVGWLFFNLGGGGVTQSVYIRAPAGQTQTIRLIERSSPEVEHPFTITDQWQRIVAPQATSQASVFVIGYGDADGSHSTPSDPGGTFYLWGAQSEGLPFATSLIATGASSATRDADVVTVTNPLSGLTQPVNVWRAGARFIPEATWFQIWNVSAVSVLLATGPNGGANAMRLLLNSSSTPTFEINDAAGATLNVAGATFNASDTVQPLGQDNNGVTSLNPGSGSPSGPGTGVIGTQDATLTIGAPTGIPTFSFYGHMTDIIMDNT